MMVSVVVPVYNLSAHLSRCVKSLLDQSLLDFEVIFVNDGSSDNSLAILTEYGKLDSRFRIVSQNNEGVSSARNAGLRLASGKYVYFMDGDDWIDKDLLKDNVLLLEQHSAQVIIFGSRNVQPTGKVLLAEFSPKLEHVQGVKALSERYARLLRENNALVPWNKIFLREWLLRAGVFFPLYRNGEDALFNLSLLPNISDMVINPRVYYNYLVRRPRSAQSQVNLGRFNDDMRVVEQLNHVFDHWGLDDEGYTTCKLLRAVYLAYRNAADYSVERDGFAQFRRICAAEKYGVHLKKIVWHRLPSRDAWLLYFILKTPSLIYLLRLAKRYQEGASLIHEQ